MEKYINEENLVKDKANRIVWDKCINKEVSMFIDGSIYNFYIVSYDTKKRKITIKYDEKEYTLDVGSFRKCQVAKIIGQRRPISKFQWNIGDIVNDNTILELTFIKDKKGHNIKACKVKCNICGYTRIVRCADLKSNHNCAVCKGNKILLGYNDLFTTEPILVQYLHNKDDAYKYTNGNPKKLYWDCPNCGGLVYIATPTIKRLGHLPCPNCGDNFSYPEKMMFNILTQLNIDFKYHYYIGDEYFIFQGKHYRPQYDLFFEKNNKKYIVELDGGFHYINHGKNDLTLEEVQYIDKQKDILANKNGYILIRINCLKSDYDYIMNNLLNSVLSELFDFSIINKNEVNKYAFSSNIKQACDLYNNSKKISQIAKEMKLNPVTIRNYIKRGTSLGWCNYVPFRDSLGNGNKKVVCLNTREIFNSIKEASELTGIFDTSITACCKHKLTTTGVDKKTNKGLIWMYYLEYQDLIDNNIDIDKYIEEKIHAKKDYMRKKVICLNTNKIFDSVMEAARCYQIKSPSGISQNCMNNAKYCGKDHNTNEKLRWMYYDEYLKIGETEVVL